MGGIVLLIEIIFQSIQEVIFLTGRNGEGYTILQHDMAAFTPHIFFDMPQVNGVGAVNPHESLLGQE